MHKHKTEKNIQRGAVNIPSIPEHEAPQQLHSESTVVSLDQTEPFGAKAGSDGKDRSPDPRESYKGNSRIIGEHIHWSSQGGVKFSVCWMCDICLHYQKKTFYKCQKLSSQLSQEQAAKKKKRKGGGAVIFQ